MGTSISPKQFVPTSTSLKVQTLLTMILLVLGHKDTLSNQSRNTTNSWLVWPHLWKTSFLSGAKYEEGNREVQRWRSRILGRWRGHQRLGFLRSELFLLLIPPPKDDLRRGFPALHYYNSIRSPFITQVQCITRGSRRFWEAADKTALILKWDKFYWSHKAAVSTPHYSKSYYHGIHTVWMLKVSTNVEIFW